MFRVYSITYGTASLLGSGSKNIIVSDFFMTLLELFFIISGVIIFFLALDIGKKKRFNALHFFVFLFVWAFLAWVAFVPQMLQFIWDIFWVQRWADVLVYASIIFLVYFVLLLLRKTEENGEELTELIREIAIQNSPKKIIHGKEVFLIPSYNEWEVLISTIKNILENWYENILIINDWSKDKTQNLIQDNFWENNNIIVLNHYKNRGQWAALETWFEYLRRFWEVKYLITFDADGQHDIADVKQFEKYLKNHESVEILLWSRFLSKKKVWVPLMRRIILKLGIIFTYFVSNIHLTDTHNWFRLIRLSTLDKIKISIDGMGHASEIIDLIAEKKIVYKEVPVNIIYTEYSLSKWQSSMNAINIALKIIWNKFFK